MFVTIAVGCFVTGCCGVVFLYENFRIPFLENKAETARSAELAATSKVERLERELATVRTELDRASAAERRAAMRAEPFDRDQAAQGTASTYNVSTNGSSARADAQEAQLPPISIELQPGIAPTDAEASRVALRQRRQLRELTFLETGKRMSNAPAGTYLFSNTLRLESEAVTHRTFQVNSQASGRDKSRHFEFHRTREGWGFLIGFTSETDASNVSNLNGRDRLRIVLFPEPHRGPMTLLSIPVDRIVSAAERTLLEGTSDMVRVVDLEVR
ncbi:MAG: hypothetical protein IT581_02945 [Verrucomicrobiales bacterium]|nr:hypothetical protein [Verrucomicrobiales bacterium]